MRYANAATTGGRREDVVFGGDAGGTRNTDEMVELDWCEATTDRDVCAALELRFVHRILRRAAQYHNSSIMGTASNPLPMTIKRLAFFPEAAFDLLNHGEFVRLGTRQFLGNAEFSVQVR